MSRRDDEDDDQLWLETLTRLWLFSKYLYRVGDKALSTPINLRAVAWSMLLVPVFWIASGILPGSWSSWMSLGLVPRLIVPGLLVWVILTKITHGARPWEVAWSWVRSAWHQRRRAKPTHPVSVRSCIRTP